jgi:hypothetical protein
MRAAKIAIIYGNANQKEKMPFSSPSKTISPL